MSGATTDALQSMKPKRKELAMNIVMILRRASWRHVLLGLLAIGGTACASTVPYVSGNLEGRTALADSATHGFEYVRVDQADGQLTVYGKVDHRHSRCESEGHVDVAVVGPEGDITFVASIPMSDRGSRRKGWYGAAFRARLPTAVPSGGRVQLAFHDPSCTTNPTFDCGDNSAAGPVHPKPMPPTQP